MAKKKILIIENSVYVSGMLKKCLEMNDYEALIVEDGLEGLSKVETERPDLIILDILLPKLDGYQVARKIRDNPTTKDIPIIGISGKISEADVTKVYEAGINDYLVKPFDIYELRIRIARYLPKETEERG